MTHPVMVGMPRRGVRRVKSAGSAIPPYQLSSQSTSSRIRMSELRMVFVKGQSHLTIQKARKCDALLSSFAGVVAEVSEEPIHLAEPLLRGGDLAECPGEERAEGDVGMGPGLSGFDFLQAFAAKTVECGFAQRHPVFKRFLLAVLRIIILYGSP